MFKIHMYLCLTKDHSFEFFSMYASHAKDCRGQIFVEFCENLTAFKSSETCFMKQVHTYQAGSQAIYIFAVGKNWGMVALMNSWILLEI